MNTFKTKLRRLVPERISLKMTWTQESSSNTVTKAVTEFVISIQAYIMYYPCCPRVDKHIRHRIKRIRRRLIYSHFVNIQ